MVQETRKEESSVFNMALAYLQRVDNLLSLSAMSSIQKNYHDWFFTLYALLREISPKCSATERTNFQKRFDSIYPLIKQYTSAKVNGGVPAKETGMIYSYLSDIEMDIRKKMDELNLLMPRSNDPRFALTGR